MLISPDINEEEIRKNSSNIQLVKQLLSITDKKVSLKVRLKRATTSGHRKSKAVEENLQLRVALPKQ